MIQQEVQTESQPMEPTSADAPAGLASEPTEGTAQPDPMLTPVTSGKSAVVDVWLAAGGLIALLVAGGVLLSRVRKKTLAAPSAMDEAETVMGMIKRLHATGEMSDDEYQATRKKLLGSMARQFRESGTKEAGRQDPGRGAGRSGGIPDEP